MNYCLKSHGKLFMVKQNEIKRFTVYNAMDNIYTVQMFWL